MMKIIYNLVAAIAILMGCVWILQGTNILHAGAMAGHVQWTGWGAVLVAIGFLLIVWTNYRKSKT
jgi:hypothetical protein